MTEVSTSSIVANALRDNRDALGIALTESLVGWEKYSDELADIPKRTAFAQRETVAFVDYLAAYFSHEDSTYRDLYIGEKLKQCYDEHDSIEEAVVRRRKITTSDMQVFIDIAGRELDPVASKALVDELGSIQNLLTHPGQSACRVLLVGDCLFIDLLGFLAVPLMEAGIQLAPTFVTSKLIGQRHRELRQVENKVFDLVFYSPLTYGFHIEFSQFQSLKAANPLPNYTKAPVDSAKTDIKSTLNLLKSLFDCPIFVHNSANLRRHDGTWREQAKTLFTRPTRALARRAINTWLPAYLDGLNSGSHRFFLIDEAAVLKTGHEHSLSRYFYNNGLQHPARFGKALASVYEDIIIAQTNLAKKKLIICDLDNTLWKGAIGEGSVAHFHDRQKTLLTLRRKGFLLAICSKNDHKNVHWRDGTLSEEDFVCQQINWDAKSANIRRIAQTLNLKTKDFIFIDDRPDERSLIKASISGITVLDAESTSTWSQLSSLASTLDESNGDRTLAYRQREERDRFLKENLREVAGETLTDDSEALAKLGLQLTIRVASRNELKRVCELINRTNQFNMCGTRTTLQEVKGWHESNQHTILVAEACDKFGSMGTISIAIIEETARGVEIIAFVLSCRVFGYGMESALLNSIKQRRHNAPIYGHFKETTYNDPCRRTYPTNGFSWEGSEWVLRERTTTPQFEWLTVKDDSRVETMGQ
jgi:FkbH-like protein